MNFFDPNLIEACKKARIHYDQKLKEEKMSTERKLYSISELKFLAEINNLGTIYFQQNCSRDGKLFEVGYVYPNHEGKSLFCKNNLGIEPGYYYLCNEYKQLSLAKNDSQEKLKYPKTTWSEWCAGVHIDNAELVLLYKELKNALPFLEHHSMMKLALKEALSIKFLMETNMNSRGIKY